MTLSEELKEMEFCIVTDGVHACSVTPYKCHKVLGSEFVASWIEEKRKELRRRLLLHEKEEVFRKGIIVAISELDSVFGCEKREQTSVLERATVERREAITSGKKPTPVSSPASQEPRVCPKYHGVSRQLSNDGYCIDCGDHPLKETEVGK